MKIEKWRAADGWRWRFWSDNGNIMAESGEGYEREAGCDNALRTLRSEFGRVRVYKPGAMLMGTTSVLDPNFHGTGNALL